MEGVKQRFELLKIANDLEKLNLSSYFENHRIQLRTQIKKELDQLSPPPKSDNFFKIVALNVHDNRIQINKMVTLMRSVFCDFIEVSFEGPFVIDKDYFCLLKLANSSFIDQNFIIIKDRFTSKYYRVEHIDKNEFETLKKSQLLSDVITKESRGYLYYEIRQHSGGQPRFEIENLKKFKEQFTPLKNNVITGPFLEYHDPRRTHTDAYLILKCPLENQLIIEQIIRVHNEVDFNLLEMSENC